MPAIARDTFRQTDHFVSRTITSGIIGGQPLEIPFGLPDGSVVLRVHVNVVTAFNGTSPTIAVGVAGTPAKYMATATSAVGVTGLKTSPGPGGRVVGDETILITPGGSGSTAGEADVIVEYIPRRS